MAKDEYGLTIKPRRFADYYLVNTDNQAEAYRKAGYAGGPSTCAVEASKLLKSPNIRAYVEMRQEEIREKTSVTVEFIVENAKRVLEKSMQDVEVMKYDYEEKRMVPTGEYVFDAKGANGALKILGDTIGAFKDKREIEHTVAANSPLMEIMEQLKN